jgi:hypothetical protein
MQYSRTVRHRVDFRASARMAGRPGPSIRPSGGMPRSTESPMLGSPRDAARSAGRRSVRSRPGPEALSLMPYDSRRSRSGDGPICRLHGLRPDPTVAIHRPSRRDSSPRRCSEVHAMPHGPPAVGACDLARGPRPFRLCLVTQGMKILLHVEYCIFPDS